MMMGTCWAVHRVGATTKTHLDSQFCQLCLCFCQFLCDRQVIVRWCKVVWQQNCGVATAEHRCADPNTCTSFHVPNATYLFVTDELHTTNHLAQLFLDALQALLDSFITYPTDLAQINNCLVNGFTTALNGLQAPVMCESSKPACRSSSPTPCRGTP